MEASWYYVLGKDRVGPVTESELHHLYRAGEKLDSNSYVWKKGFDNWKKLHEVQELSHFFQSATPAMGDDTVPHFQMGNNQVSTLSQGPNWEGINSSDRIFMVKIGADRGGREAEYGPYTVEELKRAFQEKRINERTLIFTPGMETWEFLGDLPIMSQITDTPSKIEEKDRRINTRRPFVARILFHDNEKLFEGICRDISISGMQVLVSSFPGQVGDEIKMNVHPDNSQYSFVASGVIVRKISGDLGFSLRFSDLGEEAFNAINDYVKRS